MRDIIEYIIKSELGSECRTYIDKPLNGGNINDVYSVQTSQGTFCIKLNKLTLPDLFEVESKGLKLLKSPHLRTPDVIGSGKIDTWHYLLLEFIETGNEYSNSFSEFGRGLAKLHQSTNPFFGLTYDNFIGPLVQKNSQMNTWKEFYIQNRLIPQFELAYNNGLLNRSDRDNILQLEKKFDSIVPDTRPSLLHGDLWSGNYLFDQNGQAVLIDPAVYYGHPEMDLAMTLLFGGFASDFYDSYVSEAKLDSAWKERVDIFQLYPIMVHINLFGSTYLAPFRHKIARYL